MNINRKHRYLCGTSITADDGIEVGAGFADAVARANSDDTRTVPEKTPPGAPADANDNPVDDDANGDGTGDDSGSDDDSGGSDDNEDGEPSDKRKTSQFIKDLKKERRELRNELAAERAKNSTFETRLAAIERGGLPAGNSSDIPASTSAAPDPNDAAKYPLGVLDDKYIEDKIEWVADQKVAATLDGRAQTAKAQAERAAEVERLAGLREKVNTLAERGADIFEDYEEKVLEGGLRGDWDLSETTFTAAAEAKHGERILYELSGNRAEATRVSKLSAFQQLKYVADKDAELEAKLPKARTKPRAEDVPENLPRGRNSSNPIRPDTDNLDDFRKIFYKK